jgi:hypothetical protein
MNLLSSSCDRQCILFLYGSSIAYRWEQRKQEQKERKRPSPPECLNELRCSLLPSCSRELLAELLASTNVGQHTALKTRSPTERDFRPVN